MRIVTEFIFPPMPLRDWDWSAVEDGYEPGDPIGWGATEEEAIDCLMEQIEERGE